MKEILGGNLKRFFDTIDKNCSNVEITYANNRYEVWKVSDSLFKDMCDMSEEEFIELAGDEAWWRSSDGSNLGNIDGIVEINGKEMFGWIREEDIDDEYTPSYYKLTDYLCDYIGASQPRNVCACVVDLAKYNNMTMGELFKKYEG